MTLSTFHKRMIVAQVSKCGDIDKDLIDIQNIDSSLSYEEAKNEMFKKFGVTEEIDYYSNEEEDYYERHQEKKRRRFYDHILKNRNKTATVQKIGNTYFADSSNINLLRVDDRWPSPFKRRKPKKDPLYRRFKITKQKKSISLDINSICRKLPDIRDTKLYA